MRIVAVTRCPIGIAYTFMAAETLKKEAEALGMEIKVEIQGATGTQNELTKEDIDAANIVVLAVDVPFDGEDRFEGKEVIKTSTKDAISSAQKILMDAEKVFLK